MYVVIMMMMVIAMIVRVLNKWKFINMICVVGPGIYIDAKLYPHFGVLILDQDRC